MSAGVDGRFTTDDGVEIVYTRWAGADARPPVVLHHGFTGDATRDWVDTGVVAALVAAGRTVVAHDARGHGRSGAPHRADAYGEPRMGRDLSELVDALGVPEIDLVGFSMGAVASLAAATSERRIRRLVLTGVGGRVAEPGQHDPGRTPPEALAAALRATDPATVTDPRARMFVDGLAGRNADREALALAALAMLAVPLPLERITAPTLLVVGDADPFAQRPDVLAAAIPGARLEVIPGDHGTACTSPRFLELALEFLGR